MEACVVLEAAAKVRPGAVAPILAPDRYLWPASARERPIAVVMTWEKVNRATYGLVI
jgi:hypothetical protein